MWLAFASTQWTRFTRATMVESLPNKLQGRAMQQPFEKPEAIVARLAPERER